MKGIVLEAQSGSPRYAFKVMFNGWSPGLKRVGSDEFTITGKQDSQRGPSVREWRYTLKVEKTYSPTAMSHAAGSVITETSTNYGTREDLETLFNLGVGENKLTMLDTDHASGNVKEYEVLFKGGELRWRAVHNRITSDDAAFEVDVVLVKTTAES